MLQNKKNLVVTFILKSDKMMKKLSPIPDQHLIHKVRFYLRCHCMKSNVCKVSRLQ